MATPPLTEWREIVKRLLSELAAIPYPEVYKLSKTTVFDDQSHNYLVMVHGWEDSRRLHGCLVHVAIIGDKIWIQQDGTEYGIANELVNAGVPKEHIVLGFKPFGRRDLSGFAAA
jgi:hypothetical protein